MNLIEVLLLLIAVCLVFLTAMMIAGAIFLARFIMKLDSQITALEKSLERELMPTVREAKDTFTSIKELANSLKGAVGSLAFMFVARRSAPKLLRSIAGFKVGLDLVFKLYNKLYKGKRRSLN